MASSQCRPCQPRPTQGDVGDRELPHGSARGACRALRERELRPHSDCLQLLPQPALPKVSGSGSTRVAGRARSRAIAGAVLPRRVLAAGQDRRNTATMRVGLYLEQWRGVTRNDMSAWGNDGKLFMLNLPALVTVSPGTADGNNAGRER